MNNSLTGGMKEPQRVFGAVWLEGCAVWCGVVRCSTTLGSYITLIQQEDIA